MPYRDFQVNEILTAANVNTYLMDQSVMTFADAAARTAALPTPTAGMMTFLVDVAQVNVYDGTGWVEVSGGGGVTVSETAPVSPDEGDLWLDSTEAKMYVYYNDGSSSQWVAAVGGTVPSQGKILQVVSTTKTDTFTTTSTSYVDVTGLSVNITPSSASSKIMVFAQTTISNTQAGDATYVNLVRDSTAIYQGDTASSRVLASGYVKPAGNSYVVGQVNPVFLDSPATTSATTYKIQMRVQASTGTLNRGGDDGDDAGRGRTASSITVMEVAA